MSDPRFARLKTDPRFRKPRKKTNKVVIDDRFKSIFDEGGKKGKEKGKSTKVDKYGRKVSVTHDSDNLRRFYRLEEEEELQPERAAPDYARGEGLVESSDEEEAHIQSSESDNGEVVLGKDVRKPITIPRDEVEIDLDESQFAELDAQAALNAAKEEEHGAQAGEQTNRLAVVNLDWDHVRASHLFKIFSSVVSPSPSVQRERERGGFAKSTKGKVLHVRVYPSEFGKKRLAQEQKEGPPKDLFKKHVPRDEEDVDAQTLLEEDDGNEYDEEALRKYQLERLRYYYAVLTCDTVDAAAHIYSELDGTELERSANMFDLSFVPNDMAFDDEFRDEATQDLSGTYKGVEFVTDALRHSKVKLTWDDDDPERNKITRRTLSRKEIEESDFKAYLASSGSSDEGSEAEAPVTGKRDKMRALLLSGNDDNELLPEGWGQDVDKAGDMEITFMPGLSGNKPDHGGDEETTLERYLRKQKEKRNKKKTSKVEKPTEEQVEEAGGEADEFFADDSDENEDETGPPASKNKRKGEVDKPPAPKHVESSPAELELLLSSAEPSHEPKHFDMRSVVKAEKTGSKKRNKKGKKKNKSTGPDEDEIQQDFAINVKDDRFKALHEDHTYAIDPSNPHFKKTKSMAALLDERAKRQRDGTEREERQGGRPMDEEGGRSLKSLVESVKRKSAVADGGGGKRRKW